MENETRILNTAFDDIMTRLTGYEPLVVSVHGYGTYFYKTKNPAKNIGLVIKINGVFGDEDVYYFSDRMAKINQHLDNKGKPLLNLVIIDNQNQKLYAEDLWDIRRSLANMADTITLRSTQITTKRMKPLIQNYHK